MAILLGLGLLLLAVTVWIVGAGIALRLLKPPLHHGPNCYFGYSDVEYFVCNCGRDNKRSLAFWWPIVIPVVVVFAGPWFVGKYIIKLLVRLFNFCAGEYAE